MKIIFLLLLFIYIFFNLGKFLDVTTNQDNSDLLVCLGGGNFKNKLNKVEEIIALGNIKNKRILFTGRKITTVENPNYLLNFRT